MGKVFVKNLQRWFPESLVILFLVIHACKMHAFLLGTFCHVDRLPEILHLSIDDTLNTLLNTLLVLCNSALRTINGAKVVHKFPRNIECQLGGLGIRNHEIQNPLGDLGIRFDVFIQGLPRVQSLVFQLPIGVLHKLQRALKHLLFRRLLGGFLQSRGGRSLVGFASQNHD